MPPYPHMPAYVMPGQLTNGRASAVMLGQPVYAAAAGVFDLAQANALATSVVIGLVGVSSVAAGALGILQDDDILLQPTSAWDAICSTSGGLTFGTVYYLSPTVAGQLTPTPPTTAGQYLTRVGVGLSPTQMTIAIQPPIGPIIL